jgi:putative DNA primase/helicase
MAVNPKSIPGELKQLPQWLCWQAKQKDNGKTDKIPKDPKTDRNASHSDPATWAPFDEAINRYETDNQLAGIGFVFTKDDPLCGIDLDNCRNPETLEIEPCLEMSTQN